MPKLLAPVSQPRDLVNLQSLDDRAWFAPVHVVATADTALAGSGSIIMIDGQLVGDGARVLLAGQSDKTENGVVAMSVSGNSHTFVPAERESAYHAGKIVPVQVGAKYGGTIFYATSVDHSTGEREFGGTRPSNPFGFYQNITLATGVTEYTVTHNLGTAAVIVQTVYYYPGHMATMDVEVNRVSGDAVTLTFAADAIISGLLVLVMVLPVGAPLPPAVS